MNEQHRDLTNLIELTIENRMVLNFKVIITLEQIHNLVGKVIRTETSLRSSKVVETGRDPHVSEDVAGLNGVMKQLEERRLFIRGKTVVDLCRGFVQGFEIVQKRFSSVTITFRMSIQI